MGLIDEWFTFVSNAVPNSLTGVQPLLNSLLQLISGQL